LIKVLCPTQHKIGRFGDVPQANGMEKLNLTQQKQTFTNQKKCATTQNKQNTKVMCSRLLQHPAWKWRGPILVSALHKFVTCLLRHLLTALGSTWSIQNMRHCGRLKGRSHTVRSWTDMHVSLC